MTETRQFDRAKFQNAMCTEYSDNKSTLSEVIFNQMYDDMTQAIWDIDIDKNKEHHASLEINMSLNIKRNYPLKAKEVKHVDSRKLDFTQLHDCLTGQKLMPTKRKEDAEHGFFRIPR